MFTLADHLLAVFVGVVLPVLSARGASGQEGLEARLALAADPRLRRALVQQGTATQWLLTGLVLFATWIRGGDSTSLGLSPRGVEPGQLAAYLGAVLLAVVMIVRSERILADDARRRRAFAESTHEAPFLPRTRAEYPGWIWLSITAGFCEEVIYRGFLLGYVLAWTSGEFGPPRYDDPAAWVAALVVSLAFGASHLYQGRRGALKVCVMGSSFSALYVLAGSLWPAILLHVFVDLYQGWVWTRMLSREAGAVGALALGAEDAPPPE